MCDAGMLVSELAASSEPKPHPRCHFPLFGLILRPVKASRCEATEMLDSLSDLAGQKPASTECAGTLVGCAD